MAASQCGVACAGEVTLFGVAFEFSKLTLVAEFIVMALWYSASIVTTLLASLNEVIAAALGRQSPFGGFDSVAAALASALFVFAAAAEHMRLGRRQMIAAQRSLKTAYEDSPVGCGSFSLLWYRLLLLRLCLLPCYWNG